MFSKLITKCRKLLKQSLLITIFVIVQGRFVKTNSQTRNLIANSDFFYKHWDFDVNVFVKHWELANVLDSNGEHFKATKIRTDCLSQIDSLQKIDNEDMPPTIMSNGWIKALGHISFLAYYSFAQELNIIANNPRFVVVKNETEYTYIKQYFPTKFTPIVKKNVNPIDGNDGNIFNWHLLENFNINRTNFGYRTIYEIEEDVMQHRNFSEILGKIVLPDEVIREGKLFLKKIGVPSDAWFVGLHIREKFFDLDARKVTPKNYMLGVNEIVKRGGWVIRFGTGNMSPLPKIPNLIDLNTDHPYFRKNHPFIIASSQFVLTSHSGPGELAKAFGVPAIITNCVNPAKSILSGPKGSIYLPKRWESNGRSISFKELISGLEGYSERNLDYRSKQGYDLYENTDVEIREAVIDFFNSRKSEYESIMINSLRDRYNTNCRGEIAPSYLSNNSEWFLAV
jgi:putative glycosyltransferase (TIGR04372 family)